MIPGKLIMTLMTGLFLAFLPACSPFATHTTVLPDHPEKLPAGRPLCSGCHTDQQRIAGAKSYDSFDHDVSFVKNHRTIASQNSRVCAVCHAESFCTDCHAGKSEIKPSTLFGNRPDREQVHFGDFMTRHRFEGRTDPASCYSCHGRQNNESCRQCHRK